jgi:glycosyltransferase involved in cell wall biosynthesis
VSVVVITKNEERNIARCLTSVQWAAETIVVDANSQDRTVELATQLGATTFSRAWPGYGPQKNFGADQATQPWVLSLDADEEASPELAAELEQLFANDRPEAAFRVYVPTLFMGRVLRHYGRAAREPGHIRLYRTDSARFDHRALHETVQVNGPVGWLRSPIMHHCYPSVATYWRKIRYYAPLEAAARTVSGRPLRGNRWIRATAKFGWMMFWRRGIVDGPSAWIWIAGQAYQEWLTTGEVARRQRQPKGTAHAH